MISRILISAGIAASASFACVASTKCIPDVQPTHLTVVRGDADAVLVSEFSLTNGCTLVEFDSLTRRFPALDTLPKRMDVNTSKPSSAAALYLHTVTPKLEPAAAARCSKIKTLRRIDPIPRATVWTNPDGTDLSVGKTVPVSLDSLAVCIDGSCSRYQGAEVKNKPNDSKCLVGMYAPQARDSALAATRRKLQLAEEVVTLQRRLFITFTPSFVCNIPPIQPIAARAASLLPVTEKETRFSFPSSNVSPLGRLPSLSSWSDPRVTEDLALPRPSNAGDYFSAETLEFSVTRLRSGTNSTKDSVFRYASGVKYYQYQGFQPAIECDTAPIATIVGDTLKLDGASLQISNDGCGRMGIDGLSNNYNVWLFAPRSADWKTEFGHWAIIDNGAALPFVGDSVQAFGWKFSLDELMGPGPTLATPREAHAFTVALSGRLLSIRLDQASTVRVISPSGQILTSRELPAGKSDIEVPAGAHGLLLVGTGSRVARILVP